MIKFFVEGVPIPQGSMKSFVVKGRAVLTSDNPELKAWRKAVAAEAMKHAPDKLFDGAVKVDLLFVLPRPKYVKKLQSLQYKKPDVDKLARAILDSLTGTIITNDSRVCALEAWKHYEDEYHQKGVKIEIEEIKESIYIK